MNPKDKATFLIDSVLNTPINFPYIDSEDGQCIGGGYMTYKSATKIALITVNELLRDIENPNFDYWSKVKAEIIKL